MFDLRDDLDEVYNKPAGPAPQPKPVQSFKAECLKCGGTGLWGGAAFGYRGPSRKCYSCSGNGYVLRKTDPAKAAAAKARKIERNAGGFAEQHPAEHAFLIQKAPTWDFAASLLAGVARYGSLTERQMASLHRAMQSAQERAKAAAEREANAPEADASRIEAAIETARSNGLRRIVVRIGNLRFSPASEASKNAGAVYVKAKDGAYLGKVMGGRFVRSWNCTPEQAEQIVETAADPKAAAIAHGKAYGQCACCGRELSDPRSIEAGIGPICAEKFGW